ncbi:MAG: DUF2752 domain-containing protein [Hespellia sp.]|nr:DUF2752 domain-containing protein [Hespellia sp.]
MKRTGKQIVLDTWNLLKKDLRDNRIAFLVILLYFVCAKLVFHTICPMVFLTGLPCPACGLTRAGIALLSGDFVNAWQIHPFIYVFAVFVVLWLIQRYIIQKTSRWMKPTVIFCLTALIAFYVYRMIRYFPGEPPMSYYHRNFMLTIYRMFVR